jgi:hypothetical protein
VNWREFAPKLLDVDGLRNSLQMHTPSIDVRDPFEPPRKMYDAVGRDHFTRVGESAKARRDIEGRSAEAAADPDCLARVDPDADVEGCGGIGSGLFLEAHLELDGPSKSLSGRAEDGECFVSPHLHDRAATGPNRVANDRSESRHQPRRSFVAAFLCEPRIPADVSNQEGADLGFGSERAILAFV